MNYSIATDVSMAHSHDCLVLFCRGDRLGHQAQKLDKTYNNCIYQAFSGSGLDRQNEGMESLHINHDGDSKLVLLVQVGAGDSTGFESFRAGLNQAIGHLYDSHINTALIAVVDAMGRWTDAAGLYQQTAQICEASTYRYSITKTPVLPGSSLESIAFLDTRPKRASRAILAIKRGKAIGRGVTLCRELGDLPANIGTPGYIAEQARQLGESSGIQVTVLDEGEIGKLGMGCLLAVTRGSAEPACFIELKYTGSDDRQAPVVLIGKGVTFDSGGLSIKSAPDMDQMKFDMCGAASVLATLQAAAEMALPVNLVGLLPCCENLVDGGAFKPGDVITSMSGQTVEILSTDAEGRLVIADALTYSQQFQPAVVIDIATLTGACITALGFEISGLMANNQALATRLLKAGQVSGDHTWQLPLWDDYHRQLDSNFSDMASSAGRDGSSGAGAIVAASFLSRFAQSFRWAHLDVAGTAWLRGKDKGATGRPVPLLCEFLTRYSQDPF